MIQDTTFRKALEKWYAQHRRELPWRDITDPYRIWISEIILQQTRIGQGYAYYQRFIEEFPDAATLAQASEDEVMKAWEGLGYYSRARNLHAAATIIAQKGSFPTDYHEIRNLPGIGDYTAAAICSFAFNKPIATVDGNVFRVLSRVFGIEEPIDTAKGRHLFQHLADRLLDRQNPADYNQALMDFGAMQCTPARPHCEDCTLRQECAAQQERLVEVLPAKAHKVQQKHRYFSYFFIVHHGQMLLHRRASNDIWKNLYEPFLVETKHNDEMEILQQKDIQQFLQSPGAVLKIIRKGIKHQLTHRIIHADFFRIDLAEGYDKAALLPEGYSFVPLEQVGRYAFPALIHAVPFPEKE